MRGITQNPASTIFPLAKPVTPWSVSSGKRAFDAVLAGFGLVVLSPLMATIALFVRITSPGPVLFRQNRVGQGGRSFTLLKFRSMTIHQRNDSCLTCKGDPRVTSFGKVLRKTKLDELPQLYNVFRGDMSLVGPRPDMPQFVAALPDALRQVLVLRPGVTSAASILFRNEETLLATVPQEQLQQFYCNTIFPQKIHLDLEYARSASLFRDLKTIAKTLTILFASN